jgi:flagella basal body P-ring formation protein FlgA
MPLPMSNIRNFARTYCLATVAVLAVASTAQSQNAGYATPSNSILGTLQLHANVESPANLLTLGEVATIRASNAWKEKLAEIPLGTVPMAGKTQTLTRLEIEELLQRRGLNPAQFRWEGSQQCRVSRSAKPMNTPTQAVQQASTQQPISPQNTNQPNPIDKSRFTPTNTNPATITQAERVASQALSEYLQVKANANTHWQIRPVITPENAPLIVQRRQIVGILGGQAPWDGEQHFEFLIKGPSSEYTLPISAHIRLPELVMASSKQLAKGHILTEDDLIPIPLPRDVKAGVDECYTSVDQLIGKELKRTLSMNQAIRKADAGTETLVQTGDAIRIVVLAGDLAVESNGRALQSGGQDELIQVEEADFKGRLVARVVGPRMVEVNSQGTNIRKQANTRQTPNRIRK